MQYSQITIYEIFKFYVPWAKTTVVTDITASIFEQEHFQQKEINGERAKTSEFKR